MLTPEQEKIRDEAIKVACMYLLYERENETTLRVAFAALAQERHNHFHTKGKKNKGDESEFDQCKNDVCQAALKILQESRDRAIEFTPLSLELIDGYTLNVERTKTVCRVHLRQKDKIEPALLKPESIKIKV